MKKQRIENLKKLTLKLESTNHYENDNLSDEAKAQLRKNWKAKAKENRIELSTKISKS